jgi:hypothetical protein
MHSTAPSVFIDSGIQTADMDTIGTGKQSIASRNSTAIQARPWAKKK